MATELTPEHLQKLLNYGSELVASRGRLTHRHQSVAEKGYRNLLFAIFTRSPDVGPYTEQEVLEILSGDLGTVASLLEEMMFGAEELSLGNRAGGYAIFKEAYDELRSESGGSLNEKEKIVAHAIAEFFTNSAQPPSK